MIIQLKAIDSFVKLISQFEKADILILCEGQHDVEIFKMISKRLTHIKHFEKINVAITDAEGLNLLKRHMLPSTLALIIGKVVRRVKSVVVIVDAEELRPEERVESFVNSLRSREYEVRSEQLEQLCYQVWRLHLSVEERKILMFIVVNGIFDVNEFQRFKKHILEDHIVYLKILENLFSRDKLLGIDDAKEITKENDLKLIENANESNVREAFKHINCLLEILKQFN